MLKLGDAEFNFFREKILEISAIYLAENKKDLVRSRLLPRLDAYGLGSFGQYQNLLLQLPPEHGEWQEFINQITTNKTEFFRERSHFNILTQQFLPAWVKRNPQKSAKLRVWSAACSTGEEPYSLAMVLFGFFKDYGRFEILASDIDTEVLAHAENGVYPLNKLQEIPVEYHYLSLKRGRGQVADWFKIQDSLKKTIQFKRINLALETMKGQPLFDVIFCRNVFLYFQQTNIEKVCSLFSRQLHKDGILVLGHSESLGTQNLLWRSTGHSVYQKLEPTTSQQVKPETTKRVLPAKVNIPLKLVPQRKKVLIIDDSATMRKMLSGVLERSDSLRVVGTVGDPRETEAAIKELNPDVITLDLKMPHLNGCEVLEKVLSRYAIPTLIISAVTIEEGPEVMRALELGAVDYMEKPTFESLKDNDAGLIDRVLQAASTKVRSGPKRKLLLKTTAAPKKLGAYHNQKPLILIGASTGGIQAITEILTQLPASIPPILIVQHIPAVFSNAFAARMNQICPFHVKEAQQDDPVLQDQVLIAPGSKHMKIQSDGIKGLKVILTDEPPVNRHRPSVDVLFDSGVAAGLGPNIVAIILTGMGNDGAAGLRRLKLQGAQTIAQDEASSAVFGMPREAIRLNAADVVCPLDKIAKQIEKMLLDQGKKDYLIKK